MTNQGTDNQSAKKLQIKNPKALLLINFHSRYGKKCLPEVIWCLENTGFKLVLEYPESPRIVHELIRNYKDEVDLVIIAGGDTALNAATNALVETQIPLGILPLGTDNSLAQSLGIPGNLHQACQFIASGNIKYIDLGWVNGKYFINFASLGLGTHIANKLVRKNKLSWNILTYFANILHIFYSSSPFNAEIYHRDKTIPIKTVHIGVHNTHNHVKDLHWSESSKTDVNNQVLNICGFNIRYRWQIISLLRALKKQNGHNSYTNVIRHGENLKILTPKPIPVNTDGEVTTYTPAEFRITPQVLPVLIPNS